MIDQARSWAEIARHAPSGDNSQPWQVSLGTQGDRLTLTLGLDEATRAAPSLFDCAFVASFLSLGAFARNFALMAESEGYALTDLRESEERFTLTFAPAAGHAGAPSPAEVAALIRRRTTNRLPFKQEPLDDDTRGALTRLVGESCGRFALREFTGGTQSDLAAAFYSLDLVRYRNAQLYSEFMGKLRFGAEATQSRDGLRDTTLGAPKPALVFLRLLRSLRKVRAVRALFFVGLEKIMAFIGCLALIKNSASVFALSSDDDSPLGWFRLGFCFESLWLEVTHRHLALQPLGTTLLIYREERERGLGASPSFSAAEQARLRELGVRFKAGFGLDASRPCIAFRVGRGPVIENLSLRRPVAFSS